MRVIIAGGRDIPMDLGVSLVKEAIIASGFEITELINGGARGIDSSAIAYWRRRFESSPPEFPLKTIYADWDSHGKAAGPIRNRKMAEMADALIAIWDGKSCGTKNMIDEANKRGLKIYIHKYNTGD